MQNIPDETLVSGMRNIMIGLGMDISSEELRATPMRAASAYRKLLGTNDSRQQIIQHLSVLFNSTYEGPIILKGLRALTLCVHHLLPVTYTGDFAYLPRDHRIVGTSKPYKVFEELAKIPFVQEEFTQQFAKYFMEIVKPIGLIIRIQGQFFCNENAGLHMVNTPMVTVAKRGVYEIHDSLANEFYANIDK